MLRPKMIFQCVINKNMRKHNVLQSLIETPCSIEVTHKYMSIVNCSEDQATDASKEKSHFLQNNRYWHHIAKMYLDYVTGFQTQGRKLGVQLLPVGGQYLAILQTSSHYTSDQSAEQLASNTMRSEQRGLTNLINVTTPHRFIKSL